MIQTAGNSFQAHSRTTPCPAPEMFRSSLSLPITCLRQPTHSASRVRVRPAPSARRRQSSTLSSTLSTVVLDCATSTCQRRRAVYGKCSGNLNNCQNSGGADGDDCPAAWTLRYTHDRASLCPSRAELRRRHDPGQLPKIEEGHNWSLSVVPDRTAATPLKIQFLLAATNSRANDFDTAVSKFHAPAGAGKRPNMRKSLIRRMKR